MVTDIHKTKDLWEAGVLLANDIPLVDIERHGGICFFVFSDKLKAEKIAKRYFFGDLQINALKYRESIERLKNQIFR